MATVIRSACYAALVGASVSVVTVMWMVSYCSEDVIDRGIREVVDDIKKNFPGKKDRLTQLEDFALSLSLNKKITCAVITVPVVGAAVFGLAGAIGRIVLDYLPYSPPGRFVVVRGSSGT